MMMLHAQFVFSVLTGNQVGWDAQERDDTGVPFKAALKTHRTIIVIGLIWGAVALFVDTAFFWWLSPILAGLVLAPWLTHWSSSLAIGRAARRMKLFVTPEETESPEELATLARLTAEAPDEDVKSRTRLPTHCIRHFCPRVNLIVVPRSRSASSMKSCPGWASKA